MAAESVTQEGGVLVEGGRVANEYIHSARVSAAHVQKVSADGDRWRRNICQEGLSAENIWFSRMWRDGEDDGVRCLLRTAEKIRQNQGALWEKTRVLNTFWLYLLIKVVVSSVWVAAI